MVYGTSYSSINRRLQKVISEMKKEKLRIKSDKKKYKSECGELAFLCGEEKQLEYFIDALQRINN